MSIKKSSNRSLYSLGRDNIVEFVNGHMAQIIYSVSFIAFLILLLVVGINSRSNREKKLMVDYYSAIGYIRENKDDEALAMFESIYNSKYAKENTRTISGIRMAEILNHKNEQGRAIKIYDEVYGFKNNDEFLRNLSGLAALGIMVDRNDPNDYAEIEKRIGKLRTPDNPLLALVIEQERLFEIQRGNREKGVEILNSLLGRDADADTKSRVELFIKSI